MNVKFDPVRAQRLWRATERGENVRVENKGDALTLAAMLYLHAIESELRERAATGGSSRAPVIPEEIKTQVHAAIEFFAELVLAQQSGSTGSKSLIIEGEVEAKIERAADGSFEVNTLRGLRRG
jgi:hypothetical protein